MKLLFSIIVIAGLALFSANVQGQHADAIVGTWMNKSENTGFKIYKVEGKYYAKIAWLAEPTVDGKPKTDKKNPDPKKRNNPLIGTEIMTGFVYHPREWTGKHFYNPKTGKVFKAFLTLKGKDKLEITGFRTSRLFGKSQHWHRADLPVANK